MAVRDGLIDAVGPADAVRAAHPDLPVEDLGDAILAPGLVDAHCHLEWSLFEGLLPPADFAAWLGRFLPLRGRMGDDGHAAAARLGALRALEAGCTTVCDSGPTGAGAAAAAAAGMRAIVHLEVFGREAGAAARRAAAAAAERVAALDEAAGPRGAVGVSPHAPYTVGPELWAALAAEPGLAGRGWATHLAESAHEAPAIAGRGGPLAGLFAAAGLTPGRWPGDDGDGAVARLAGAGALRPGLVAAHCVELGPGDPGLLAAAGVAVAHCPRSNAHLRCRVAPLRALRAAGAVVALGTDSPASGGDYDPRAEARACRAAHAGTPAEPDDADLLRMITLDAARAVGADASVGSLEPGKRADLLAVGPAGEGDPVAAVLDARAAVRLVAIDGEPAVRDGRATGLDGAAIRARAAEARARLC
ncbi:amidohydrolase family protein [Miltoncostaea marina]|uniref:amidohydrolase family protein n=1 Tax=Miltoncostaea marina TaxID=2843215 RepID=UPI001C3E2065|nr:amidohydrolase family protein [Miltoncostaea marina]